MTTSTPDPAPADTVDTRLDAIFAANESYLVESPSQRAKRERFEARLEKLAKLDKILRGLGNERAALVELLAEDADDLDIDLFETHGIEVPSASESEDPQNAPKGTKKGSRLFDRFDHSRKH